MLVTLKAYRHVTSTLIPIDLDGNCSLTPLVLEVFPPETIITQARWSGDCLCVELPGDSLPSEDTPWEIVTELEPGQVAVSLTKPFEVVVAYGMVRYYVPDNPNAGLVVIGEVKQDSLRELEALGFDVWRQGFRYVNLKIPSIPGS